MRDIDPDSFLSKMDNIETLNKLLEKAQFAEIQTILNQHKDDKSLDPIRGCLDIILPLLTDTTTETDSLTGKVTMYYKDIRTVNQKTHFATFYSPIGSVKTIIGFVNDNWLFWDKTYIKVDENEPLSESTPQPKRDINDDGTITESSEFVANRRILEQLKENSKVTVRFEGLEGILDYDLSNDEVQAYKIFKTISDNAIDISNYLFIRAN